MVFITSEKELQNWDGTGTAVLRNNITLTGVLTSPIKIRDGGIFDGNKHTITLHTVNSFGLFVPHSDNVDIKVKNILINANRIDELDKDCGVLIGSTKTIDGYTLEMIDCCSIGKFNIGINGGGIMGASKQKGEHNVTITGCYSTGIIKGSGSGGICGGLSGVNGVLRITNCYSTGDITGGDSGGIVGTGGGCSSRVTLISNCYSTGTINGDNCGGVCGNSFGLFSKSAKVVNCYSSGLILKGSGMLGSNLGKKITVKHCYARGSTSMKSGDKGFWFGSDEPNIRHCNIGNEREWDAVFEPEDGYSLLSNRTWVPGGKFKNGFGLNYFRSGQWDSDVYVTAAKPATFLHNDAIIMPHMRALDGSSYELVTNKYFRLFDNGDENDRLIINAAMSKFNYPEWRKRKYVKTIYVQYKENTIIINTGFMGRKAEVIKNEGSTVIEDVELSIDKKSSRYCLECKYSGTDDKRCDRHFEQSGHQIPQRERNALKFSIETRENRYNFSIENVNEHNMEPCKIFFNMENGSKHKIMSYRGTLVKTMKNNSCDINNLYDDIAL